MARQHALVLLVLACVAVCGASGATTNSTTTTTMTATAKYANFYTAVSLNSDSKLCKQIVDTLALKTVLSNPSLALTIFVPSDKAFNTLAAKLKMSITTMSKNTGLMKQVMYYHFITGSNGVKKVYTTAGFKVGMKLDTMYISPSTKKAYQLAVGTVAGTKVQIKSVGTSAYIYKPNVKCGLGYAHGIDNVLSPMSLSSIPTLRRLSKLR